MFGIGASELIIIFLFALLFIGPKKLPELAKGLGKGIREFQKAKDDLMDQVNTPASSEQKIETEDPAKEASILTEVKVGNFERDPVSTSEATTEESIQDVVAVSEDNEQEISVSSEDTIEETAQEVTAASIKTEEPPKSDA